ncbi:uncharacterized protein LOC135088160 [Ostrinia nubilalis]|uniref:uncharacterized protein LOC135088160 n=1 Tax=Ostrinia nubilalis TaxID=29057 RepID=UPI003082634C
MVRELTPELAKLANEELNENPKQIKDDLQHIKDWIAKQPHLRARTDDQWLVGLLRGCKFSLERLKKKLDLYYTLKTTAADITLTFKPTEQAFLDFLRVGTVIVLPKAKTLHPRVILIRPGAYDPSINTVSELMCILYYLVQIVVVEDDVATVMGTKIVVDYEGVTMSHLTQANPSTLKKMIAVSQDSMPLRLKGSHHMRLPSGIEVIFTLISGLLNEKAKQRLKIHRSTSELLDFLPKEIIPAEYGGDGGTFKEMIEYWAGKIVEYKEWMQEEQLLGTDESKRPKQSGYNSTDVDGSFRQLEIDYSRYTITMAISIRPLPAALLKKAQEDINEDPKRVDSDIQALKTWLGQQPHLHSVQPSDQWIVAFLRGSKFSLERSKEKMDMYYTLKTIVPEFFANRDPLDPRIQEILQLGTFLPLKKCKEEDSSRINIVRLGLFNPSKFHLSDVLKVSFMITEILFLEDDNFTVAGEEVIVDMKGVGVSVLSQWTPALAKKAVSTFEKALPVRVRANHILNTPTGFEAAYNIFRTFLGEKLKKRILVHNQNYEAMYKTIPKSILPVEYGGEDGSVVELTEYWKAKVESYRDWFLKEESTRSDESKRPGTPKTSSALFGVEGSFRKLEVD